MKAKVYVTRLEDYIPEVLGKKLRDGLETIGGIEKLVSGKKVFVKINQLANRPPEEAVTTHPLIVEKVVEILLGYGAKVVIGDDIDTEGEKDGFIITGMRDVARRLNVELLNLRKYPYEKIEKRDNKFIKELYIAKPVLEAEAIVNIPKLKTHSQTVLTASIKNLYGIIPLGERSRLHAAFPRIEDFSEALVDVFNSKPPLINIMDGVLAMEGEGPMSGSPRKLGLLLVSRDAVALDSVISSILGLTLSEVKHIPIAASRGLGIANLSEIDVMGLEPAQLKVSDFKFPKIKWQAFIPAPLYKFVYKRIRLRPRILSETCKLCSKCIERCPVQAMEIKKGRLTIDYKLCIGCLCCQEICGSRAIESVRSRSGEALVKSLRVVQRLKSHKP